MNEPRMGWICPRCQVVKSPDQNECRCQMPPLDYANIRIGSPGTTVPAAYPFPPPNVGGMACGRETELRDQGETLP